MLIAALVVAGVSAASAATNEESSIIEVISITPAEGEVAKLQNFEITFGGEIVEVNPDVIPTLGEQDGGIGVSEDGKTVFIDFEEPITTPGTHQLDIPAGAIIYNGQGLDPLSFKYNIKGADYNITPSEGEVEKLETFTINFSNYRVDVNEEEAKAYLFNIETETETEASFIASIAGGTAVYIMFPEIKVPGQYELIVADGSIQKTIDGSFLPELAFGYVITGADGIPTLTRNKTVNYHDISGRTATAKTRGLVIRQIHQADGSTMTMKIIRK